MYFYILRRLRELSLHRGAAGTDGADHPNGLFPFAVKHHISRLQKPRSLVMTRSQADPDNPDLIASVWLHVALRPVSPSFRTGHTYRLQLWTEAEGPLHHKDRTWAFFSPPFLIALHGKLSLEQTAHLRAEALGFLPELGLILNTAEFFPSHFRVVAEYPR
jgi:hypothetical protein